MRERFVFPIILILGLGLYLPVLGAGTFILDDANVIAQAKRVSEQPILNLFVRGSGGTYYRPVLFLSYLFDIKVSGAQPAFMHLVNIMIHVMNAFLVYLNVRIFYPQKDGTICTLPLAAALLFLVHPINTESINWISGRSDPFAAFFMLIATYLVFSSMKDLKQYRLWLAAIFLILGSMSKEVAFFSFPAITLFILLYKVKRPLSSIVPGWPWRLSAIVPLLLGGAIYFLMRSGLFKHVDKGISKVTNVETYLSPVSVTKQFITDFGFYIKKLFIPQPLTLTIDQIHPNYFWVGILAIILFVTFVLMRNYLTGMTLLIALTIFPALLNALLNIAWTPYAERYLYVPSAFFCIALALPHPIDSNIIHKLQKAFIIILICFFLPTTIYRNSLWAEPLELTRLTHQQNPDNPTMWSMYAVMLANKEFYGEAREEFLKVLQQHPDHLYTYESLSSMEMFIHDPVAARKVLEKFFKKELEPDYKILKVMLESNQGRLAETISGDEIQEIRGELIDTHLNLYKFDRRSEHFLAAGELAQLNGDYESAETHFKALVEKEGVPEEHSAKARSQLEQLRQKDKSI